VILDKKHRKSEKKWELSTLTERLICYIGNGEIIATRSVKGRETEWGILSLTVKSIKLLPATRKSGEPGS
jgi:hypothetical protein